MEEEHLVRIRVGEARQQGLKAQQGRRLLGLHTGAARRASVEGSVIITALLIGVLIGVLGTSSVQAVGRPQLMLLEGYAWVNEEGTAIGLSPDGQAPGVGYAIAGAMWREEDGPWHDTFPSCLEPLDAGQHVRLGVLNAGATPNAPHRPIVMWVECLD